PARWLRQTPSSAEVGRSRHPASGSAHCAGRSSSFWRDPAVAHTAEELELRGELREQLVGALQRLPELGGRDLTLIALSGGITNRNFLVAATGADDRYVVRLAGNDTHLLGISREVEHAATVAAAG